MWLCSSSTSIIEDRDLSAHLNILTIRDRLSVALLGGFAIPLGRLCGVLPHAFAPVVAHAEPELCLSAALLGGFAIPLGPLCVVLPHALAPVVASAKVELCLSV